MTGDDSKFDKVERLIAIFKPERYSYMAISVISAVVLIVVAVIALARDAIDNTTFIGLFLPAGAITFSVGRIMKMWNDVIKILFGTNTDTEDGKK